jgi:hypothetical protein
MAQKYIHPDKIAVIVVGDAAGLLEQVKPYSDNIEIFDAEGNLKDMNDYVVDSNLPPAQLSGAWTLSVEAMGQAMQINLQLDQNGSDVTGKMESAMVNGDINGTVTGNKLNATTKTSIMGQDVELNIVGAADGDSMSGTINTGMPMLPELPFTARRGA